MNMSTQVSERAETLQMLRDSVADFARGHTDFKRLRERRGVEPGYDAEVCRQMGAQGWFGILVPEQHGGLGLGFAEMCCVLQALGGGLMADPLVSAAVLAARLLVLGGNEALNARLLPSLAAGEALPAVAWQEGIGGIDPCDIQTRAQREGGGYRISGGKRFVAGAAGASGFIVSARVDDSFGLFWVDANAPGLKLSQEWRADQTPSGLLTLDSVAVGADSVVYVSGAGAMAAVPPSAQTPLAPLSRALDEAAVMASAEMVGVMQAALQMALAYMRTRVQFGKPIGSFQALQHKAADLYVQQELARAVLDDAVTVLDDASAGAGAGSASVPDVDPRERALIASRCKARCSDAGLRITREVIQLHGAIGYTDEYDAGLFLKRAMVLSGWLGNASQHRRRFAALTSAPG